MHRAILELSDRLTTVPRLEAGAPQSEEAVKDLAKGVDQLVRQMRAEQKVVREWVDEQAAQQGADSWHILEAIHITGVKGEPAAQSRGLRC